MISVTHHCICMYYILYISMQLHIVLQQSPPRQLAVQPLPAWKAKNNVEEEPRALEAKLDPPEKVSHHYPALFTCAC